MYIESFYIRIRASLHIGYTLRWMERVRTAASPPAAAAAGCRVSDGVQEAARDRWRCKNLQRSHKSHAVGEEHGQYGCLTLSAITAGFTRGGDWSSIALLDFLDCVWHPGREIKFINAQVCIHGAVCLFSLLLVVYHKFVPNFKSFLRKSTAV